ncbi:UTP--glucose-1-phosphate uridylyltransferase GalU [Limnobacter sp.]|uniref:UTP--glucose-1-phosphate uridylyltransferase GalU n=1 Tax=Limnobacter sp. TaxID=2003368 RepID=UPI003514FC9D
MSRVRKAVFPVAGMGTRFLPATKASPKEMMPVVDKPLIQYAVEEALDAGITEMVFITGRSKRAIEDHFDKAYELEAELQARGKKALLEVVKNIVPSHVNCIYIRQMEPLGLGHAVLCAEPVVGNEPFAVLLADDLMDVCKGKPSVTHQMVKVYDKEHASILAVQEVPMEETKSYGIVSSSPWNKESERVNAIVEKPDPKDAPTNLAVVGRYVLNPQIFDRIRKVGKGAGGEIQLTDGIAALLNDQPVLAYRFDGTRFDCGSKIGYLKATVELGLKHPEVADEFASYLATLG